MSINYFVLLLFRILGWTVDHLIPVGMDVVNGKPSVTWVSGAPKSEWALGYYDDETKVTEEVGLKNDKEWLPIYGLFSDKLPFVCRTQVLFSFTL